MVSWLACVSGCSSSDDGDNRQGDAGSETASDAGSEAASDASGQPTPDSGGEAVPDAGASEDAGATTVASCDSGALDGDYVIESDEDVALIADCPEITGDLTVTGDVEAVSLPALVTVGGAFRVEDTTSLTSLEIPALTTTAQGCEVNANAELTQFLAPALEETSVLGIIDNPVLTEVDVGALTDAGFIRIQRNAALPTLAVPLVEVLGVFFVSENESLVSASFESLTTITIDGFIVTMNPLFTTLDLPVLTDVFGDILISMNPMFPQCRADEIEAQIDDPSVPFVSNYNDESATCP